MLSSLTSRFGIVAVKLLTRRLEASKRLRYLDGCIPQGLLVGGTRVGVEMG